MKDVSSKVSPPWTGCGCLFAGTVRPLYLCSRLTLAANAVCWPLWTLSPCVCQPPVAVLRFALATASTPQMSCPAAPAPSAVGSPGLSVHTDCCCQRGYRLPALWLWLGECPVEEAGASLLFSSSLRVRALPCLLSSYAWKQLSHLFCSVLHLLRVKGYLILHYVQKQKLRSAYFSSRAVYIYVDFCALMASFIPHYFCKIHPCCCRYW